MMVVKDYEACSSRKLQRIKYVGSKQLRKNVYIN